MGTPNTATITILSNDNAFGIISFNSVSLFLHYFFNEQREESVQSVLGRGDCKSELFSLVLCVCVWGGGGVVKLEGVGRGEGGGGGTVSGWESEGSVVGQMPERKGCWVQGNYWAAKNLKKKGKQFTEWISWLIMYISMLLWKPTALFYHYKKLSNNIYYY